MAGVHRAFTLVGLCVHYLWVSFNMLKASFYVYFVNQYVLKGT